MESAVDFAERVAGREIPTGPVAATDTDGVPTSTSTVATAAVTTVALTTAS